MWIRTERAGDQSAIAAVHLDAFAAAPDGGPAVEAALVDTLRASGAWIPEFSLVAELDGAIIGHVVCSRGWIATTRPALGLGPLGVVRAQQGVGVGSALVEAVLAAADSGGEHVVALLGSPAYYGRFGFVPARAVGIESPEPAWGDAFQAHLLPHATPDDRGPFRYAAPFDALG